MAEFNIKIAFLGNLCNMSYQIVSLLRERGIPVFLYISLNELQEKISSPVLKESSLNGDLPEWIYIWNRAVRYFQRKNLILRIFERIITLGCAVKVIFQLKSYELIVSSSVYSVILPFTGRPYLALAQGDDLRQLALKPTIMGWLMRRAFRAASITYISFDGGHRKAAQRIGLLNTRPLRWPYDMERYRSKNTAQSIHKERLMIFMPSNQDWRPLQKGNDRFLRAFARLLHEGQDMFLTLLERGPDKGKAHRLIEELRIKSAVRWLPTLNQEQLIEQFQQADLVADQFLLGSFGSIALEAMACGKAVMLYIDEESLDGFYSEAPPILNVSTEDEIYLKLKEFCDSAKPAEMGKKARDWMCRYHNKGSVIDNLLKDIDFVIKSQNISDI
jgi:glycosyltransferase involved in cell wall biosynthesis